MLTRPTGVLAESVTSTLADRRLDALAVEAVLKGRRPFHTLPAAEADDVVGILRRRGLPLDQAAALLDVMPSALLLCGTAYGSAV